MVINYNGIYNNIQCPIFIVLSETLNTNTAAGLVHVPGLAAMVRPTLTIIKCKTGLQKYQI